MTQWMKSQGAKQPTAFGSLLQQSAYGATIPVYYGTVQGAPLAIWAANLRLGGSTKKFKQFKKATPSYVENIDFMVGHNPVMAILRIWQNGTLFPMNSVKNTTQNTGSSNTGIAVTPLVPNPFGPGNVPDPFFYCVTAITMNRSYSFTFNDYGSQGVQTLSGNWEVPFWNELEQGPDPTRSSSWKYEPNCYRWEPSYGAFIDIDTQPGYGSVINIYYTQMFANPAYSDALTPLAILRASFEPKLGSGTEYADADLSDQQIIYPHFAGFGSSEIDLGAAGALPQLLTEVRGKWGIYPSGDGDFADYIEDIVKSGIAQACLQDISTPPFTQMERGLSSYNLPGCIQRKFSNNDFGPGPIPYNLPTQAGNFLVVTATDNDLSETLSISDTGGNTWIPLLPVGHGCQIWYAVAVGGPTSVAVPEVQQLGLFEIGGCDTFDSVEFVASGPVSLTTTNAPGFGGFVMSFGIQFATKPDVITPPFFNVLLDETPAFPTNNNFGCGPIRMYGRTVRNPTEITCQPMQGPPLFQGLIAFKATQPASYPVPLGDFIDDRSLDLVRCQCRAYGLWGSLVMNSQSAGKDWLRSLYFASNAAPVYLGNKLFSYPYAEASFAANGVYYTSPTSAGPVANLNADNGDFHEDGCPSLETVDRIGLPNVLQLQCFDRAANYNQVVVQQPDAASIALYGVRKADPIVNNAIMDPSIARALLGVQARRNQYGAGDTWSVTLSPRWMLLSPMDLVTLTDNLQALVGVPVRITSMEEDTSNGSFKTTGEPFIYGMCTPTALPTDSPQENPTNIDTSAGDVNAPIIFEPTQEMYPGATGKQLWVVVSSGSDIYGGCQVLISTDGGTSYQVAGDPLAGSATTGFITTPWPAASSPDTTNDLGIDVSECNGTVQSLGTTVENNLEYSCYVQSDGGGYAVNGTAVAFDLTIGVDVDTVATAGVGTTNVDTVAVADTSVSDGFGYEMMAYGVATLTAPSKYTLKATGSGNFLLRAVLNAPNGTGTGVNHALGARFAVITPARTGILQMQMPDLYIGQTIFFKIISFNAFGNALQSQADVPAYGYVPTGDPGSV